MLVIFEWGPGSHQRIICLFGAFYLANKAQCNGEFAKKLLLKDEAANCIDLTAAAAQTESK